MALYNISEKILTTLEKTSFTIERLQERYDLQEAIKKNIDIVAPAALSYPKNSLIGRIVGGGLIY